MGVIHKLKQEVIDFIIDQKRNNPKFGCRELAELTSNRFQVKISKSSVNSIIKNSNLSSSVGRPGKNVDEKNKKFQIPSEKKQQISKELHKIPLPSDQNQVDPRKNDLELSNQLEKKPTTISITKVTEKTSYVKYVGLIFLKAAFWENVKEEFLGTLVQTYNSGDEKSLFDKKCNGGFIYTILDIHKKERDLDIVISLLDNIKVQDINPEFSDTTIPEKDTLRLISKLDLELQQLSNLVRNFSIKLKNGRIINLDANISHLIDSNSVINIPQPLKTSIDKLSNYIIGNRFPLMLLNSGEAFDQTLFNLVAAFECIKGFAVEEIVVMGDRGYPLAEFSIIPEICRTFAIGILPNCKEFDDIIKSARWTLKDAVDWDNEEILFTTTKSDFFSKKINGLTKPLTLLTLWEKDNDQPKIAILTNTEGWHKYIISKYLHDIRFMNDKNAPAQALFEYRPTLHSRIHCLRDFFGEIYEFFSEYIIKQYFQMENFNKGTTHFLSDIYRLNGRIDMSDDVLSITLNLQDSDSNYEFVKKASQIINRRNFTDNLGRALYIKF